MRFIISIKTLLAARNCLTTYQQVNSIPTHKVAAYPTYIKWCPPTHLHVKLNFDDSVYNPIQATARFVVRNHLGDPVLAMSKNLGSMEILQVEGCALRDGLSSINPLIHDSITVEGDSMILIDAINGAFTTPWRIKGIVADINFLKLRFHNISFRHIWRKANFVADKLANLEHRLTSRTIWHNTLPPQAISALHFDHLSHNL